MLFYFHPFIVFYNGFVFPSGSNNVGWKLLIRSERTGGRGRRTDRQRQTDRWQNTAFWPYWTLKLDVLNSNVSVLFSLYLFLFSRGLFLYSRRASIQRLCIEKSLHTDQFKSFSIIKEENWHDWCAEKLGLKGKTQMQMTEAELHAVQWFNNHEAMEREQIQKSKIRQFQIRGCRDMKHSVTIRRRASGPVNCAGNGWEKHRRLEPTKLDQQTKEGLWIRWGVMMKANLALVWGARRDKLWWKHGDAFEAARCGHKSFSVCKVASSVPPGTTASLPLFHHTAPLRRRRARRCLCRSGASKTPTDLGDLGGLERRDKAAGELDGVMLRCRHKVLFGLFLICLFSFSSLRFLHTLSPMSV